MGLIFGGYTATVFYLGDFESDNIYTIVFVFLLFLIPWVYVVCRLYLVVEIFRCLCFLPPSAYVATWATNVPHVA